MSKIITPKAMLSYPHLFTPQAAQDGGKEKYSCALVFDADTDISFLKKAAIETAIEKWGEKAKDMIRKGQLRMPFRDGGEKDYPEGSTFINVRSDRQPGIVSLIPDPKTGRPLPITDPDDVYAGAIVRASIAPFAYDTNGNRGVSFALNNIQKLADGERIDGRTRAEDEFDADPNAVASLEDLTDDSAQQDETPEPGEKAAKKAKGKAQAAIAADELADLLK